MLIIGAVLLILGFVTGVPLLWTLGVILVVVGAILELGYTRRGVGRRRYY